MTCSAHEIESIMFWATVFIVAIILVAARAWRYAKTGEE